MIEPLPCPFCGSTTIHVKDGSTFRWIVAYCCECDAQCGETRASLGHEAAFGEWNTRTNSYIVGDQKKEAPKNRG